MCQIVEAQNSSWTTAKDQPDAEKSRNWTVFHCGSNLVETLGISFLNTTGDRYSSVLWFLFWLNKEMHFLFNLAFFLPCKCHIPAMGIKELTCINCFS